MKKVMVINVVIIAILLQTYQSNAQFTFSVNPGIQLNSAAFGYKISKFVPYTGLQILSCNSSLVEKGKRYDYDIGDVVNYEDDYKISGTIYIPVLGTKYFFIEKNKLKAYGNICLSKFFLSGKITDSTDPQANSELDDIKKTSIWAGQIGFGTEYFFDDNFSIGGEFGFRLLHLKYKEVSQDGFYNPNTGNHVSSTTTYEYKLNVNPTYVKLSLNFYFQK